jgi:uncharacterized lipoprotein YmbA
VTFAAAACMVAASCGPLARPATDRQLYAIDPGRPPAARPPDVAPAGAPATALRVRRLQVVNPYAGSGFVYRNADGTFRTDYYNGFVTAPSEQLTGAFVDWLSHSGSFASVVDSASSVPARYVLEGSVTALYGDYSDRSAPKAVIEVRLFVLDEQARGSPVAFQKEYRAAAPIKPASTSSLAKGWSESLKSILGQVDADLQSRLGPDAGEHQALNANAR